MATPNVLKLRVDWSHQDLFGHVNNVQFFNYTQAARLEICEQVGLNKLYRTKQIGPILAMTQSQFIRPLFFPGTVTIQSLIIEVGTSSFKLSHILTNDDGAVVAEAQDVVVVYNFELGEKKPIPPEIRSTMKKFMPLE